MALTRSWLTTVALIAAAAGSTTAAAQGTQASATPPADTVLNLGTSTPQSGPRMQVTGMRRNAANSATAAQRPVSMGRPMALMVVGGAALVLGALIGGSVGDLFMLGGAVSFLIGLYEYIR